MCERVYACRMCKNSHFGSVYNLYSFFAVPTYLHACTKVCTPNLVSLLGLYMVFDPAQVTVIEFPLYFIYKLIYGREVGFVENCRQASFLVLNAPNNVRSLR